MTVAEEDTRRLDRGRDLRGWLVAPLVTLVLAPALAISIGILVAESSTSYPGICDAAAATNGCEEAVVAMFALHARIFAAGWLLLWALPWWRGLRPYRIGAAIVVGAVLLGAPLRLVSAALFDGTTSSGGLFTMNYWDHVIRDGGLTAGQASHLGVGFAVLALVIVGLPAFGALWFGMTRRRAAAAVCALLAIALMVPGYELARLSYHASDRSRQLSVVPDPDPPCQVHSGSDDVCPGG